MMRTTALITGGVITVAVGAALLGLLWLQPTRPAAAPSPLPGATAEITRGTLLDTKTVTGALGYGALSALRPGLTSASAVVTWIAPVGSTVERGEPLYTLDGQPAILYYGSVPQYRTLRFDPSASTPVWVELEQAEIAAETAALRLRLEQVRLADAETRLADLETRLEDALSPTPGTPEFIQLSGAVRTAQAKLGRVTELSAAELAPSIDIVAAEAELAIARATFDAALRALRKDQSAAGLDVATARVAISDAEVEFAELRRDLDTLVARASNDADIAQIAENLAFLGYDGTLAKQVRAWQLASGLPVTGIVGPSQVVVASGPLHIAAHSATVGETLAASSPDRGSILDYSSTERLVTVPLSVGDHALAAVGRAVTLTLPDDTAIEGKISEIGSVVTDGAVEMTVAVPDQAALDGFEVASVDVEFISDGLTDVLSVPVAALLARPEGGFAVELVSNGTSALVPVDIGLFAAGRVEIHNEVLTAGMLVGVPR